MSTVVEIMLLAAGAEVRLDQVRRAYGDAVMFGRGMLVTSTREVSAARARTLKRRGEFVWYSRRTSTGRARYQWLCNRRVKPSQVYR